MSVETARCAVGGLAGPCRTWLGFCFLVLDPREVLNHWQFPGRGVKESDLHSSCYVQDGWCLGSSGSRRTGWEAVVQIRPDTAASTQAVQVEVVRCRVAVTFWRSN